MESDTVIDVSEISPPTEPLWPRPSIFRPCLVISCFVTILVVVTTGCFIAYGLNSTTVLAPLFLILGTLTGSMTLLAITIGFFKLAEYYKEFQLLASCPPPLDFPLIKSRGSTDKEEELYECLVCRTNHRDVFPAECRHISMCSACANLTDRCPLCRQVYQRSELVRIFFS